MFSGVAIGTRTIWIKDSSSCEKSYTVVITQPTAVSVSGSGTNPLCDGGTDGRITWSVSGGSGSYTYTQNGIEITNLSQTGLGEGTYTLIATDSNGCTGTASAILNKTAVAATVSQSNVTCNGGTDGSITVSSPSGGNGPTYQVKLNSGGTYVNYTGVITYSNLSATTYTVYVKDSQGCVTTYSKTITQPSTVTFTTSTVIPTCYNGSNGSITIFSTSGGNGTYTYSKNGGTTYQASNSFTSLSNGTYSIRVKDSNGCLSSISNVTLNRTAPSASFSHTAVSCYGGSDGTLTISNPTGGAGGAAQTYQYKIDDGVYVSFQSTSYIYTNITAGLYTIWIKDSLGCEKSYTHTVTQPTQLTATMSNYVVGPNGSVTVTSSGGTWPKTYRLYNDTTSPYQVGGGTLVSTITGVTAGNPSQIFSNLPEGFYYVTVTDANGCTASTIIQSTYGQQLLPSPGNCVSILFECLSSGAGGGSCDFGWTDCDGVYQSLTIPADTSFEECVDNDQPITASSGGQVSITPFGSCSP